MKWFLTIVFCCLMYSPVEAGSHAVFQIVTPGAESSAGAASNQRDTIDVWVDGSKYRLDTREGISFIYYSDGDSLTWLHHETKRFRTTLGAIPGASAMFGAADKRFVRSLTSLVRFTDMQIDSTAKRALVGGHECKLYVMKKRTISGEVVATTEIWVDPELRPGYFEIGKVLGMGDGSIPDASEWNPRLRAIAGLPVRTIVRFESEASIVEFPASTIEQWLLEFQEWPGDEMLFTIPRDYSATDPSLREEF